LRILQAPLGRSDSSIKVETRTVDDAGKVEDGDLVEVRTFAEVERFVDGGLSEALFPKPNTDKGVSLDQHNERMEVSLFEGPSCEDS
jgi:hypothetical protein